MIKFFLNKIKKWWKMNIISKCPPEIEDDEFSEKYR